MTITSCSRIEIHLHLNITLTLNPMLMLNDTKLLLKLSTVEKWYKLIINNLL